MTNRLNTKQIMENDDFDLKAFLAEAVIVSWTQHWEEFDRRYPNKRNLVSKYIDLIDECRMTLIDNVIGTIEEEAVAQGIILEEGEIE